jgi:hypothetical protein
MEATCNKIDPFNFLQIAQSNVQLALHLMVRNMANASRFNKGIWTKPLKLHHLAKFCQNKTNPDVEK